MFDQLPGAKPSPAAGEPGAPVCSRKACRQSASWQLLWNNPRIHTPERRKVWLACSEHREWLQEYLTTRGLWKQTLPLEGSPAAP
nr:hypothetical protein [Arthrobacter subterraneus]